MPLRKFAKRKPADRDLQAEAMKINSTSLDRGEEKNDLLGGIHSAPSARSNIAAALYGKGGQLSGG